MKKLIIICIKCNLPIKDRFYLVKISDTTKHICWECIEGIEVLEQLTFRAEFKGLKKWL